MKRVSSVRLIVQVLLIGLSGVLIYLMNSGSSHISPHGVCPYSFVCFGVPTLASRLASNPFIFASLAGAVILLSTLVLGRAFCGWVCPVGAIQEFIYKANGKQRNNKRPLISKKRHDRLKYLKYLVLIMNLVLAYHLIQFLYMNLCPVIALSNIGKPVIISSATLALFILSSLFVERFFCKYLCPLAAVMNITQFLGKFLRIPRRKVTIDKSKCLNCSLCSKNCPMQIAVEAKSEVDDVECIMCQRCHQACPVQIVNSEYCR